MTQASPKSYTLKENVIGASLYVSGYSITVTPTEVTTAHPGVSSKDKVVTHPATDAGLIEAFDRHPAFKAVSSEAAKTPTPKESK